MPYSIFGNKFTQHSGITELMDDLNEGVKGGEELLMLGGGNPASIPRIEERLTELMQQLLDQGKLVDTLANYDGPKGKDTFAIAISELFNDLYGWDLSAENVMLTNGSQNAFFYLFNLLGGNFSKLLLQLIRKGGIRLHAHKSVRGIVHNLLINFLYHLHSQL